MSIIFDLDQTLINSSSASALRDKRNWSAVYNQIPKFETYEGIAEALKYLADNKMQYCIVTASPSTYCHKVCAHWNIDFTHTVCFHDTNRRKPHPDPILKAIDKMKTTGDKVLSFGDRDIDITASNSAGVISVACLWGTENPEALLKAGPTHILKHPSEIVPLLQKLQDKQNNP